MITVATGCFAPRYFDSVTFTAWHQISEAFLERAVDTGFGGRLKRWISCRSMPQSDGPAEEEDKKGFEC